MIKTVEKLNEVRGTAIADLNRYACRVLVCSGTFGAGVLNGGAGIMIIPEGYPAMQMVMPVGGFLALGCILAGFQYMTRKMENAKKDKEAAK